MTKQTYIIISVIVIIFLSFILILKSNYLKAESFSIGYVDIQKALDSHPDAEKANKEFQEFKNKDLKDFQEKEQTALDEKLKKKFGNRDIESLPKEEQMEAYKIFTEANEKFKKLAEKKLNDKYDSLIAPLLSDLEKAIKDIGKKKNLTVILDKNVVLYGGIDITSEVIAALKSK